MASDVNEKLSDGSTYLIRAVERRDVAEVVRLLDRGAKIEGRDGWGRTALIVAAVHGSADLAGILIERGANLDAVNHTGLTALIEAVSGDHLDVANLLIAAGADVNIRSRHGYSACDFARSKVDPRMQQLIRPSGSGERPGESRRR